MRAAAISDLQGLRDFLGRASPPAALAECVSTGFESLDQLVGGGYPQSALSVISGVEGAGRMSLVAKLLADETRRARPVAWVDAAGTLYPPALHESGVRLERLLVVRTGAERAVSAMEQILGSGAFRVVVSHGLETALSAPRLRRLQTAAETGKACALMLLDPRCAREVQSARLKLRVHRRSPGWMVEVDKNSHGVPGKKALVA